ncbi:MAG: DUF4301 family protein, partial [Bacteroidales bacterium]|nr:DUF4301 family protein [Bacteroidales bacterium]
NIRLHFTVSPEHKSKFMELLERVRDYYENRFGVKYQVEFSVQEQSTDTLSVDMNNQPFRETDGSMLFRPGGHGALINNLDKIDSDIIFIKNIDNVVPEHHINDTITYKKVLAGVLIGIQKQLFEFQESIEKGLTGELLENILEFYKEKLYVEYSQSIEGMTNAEKLDFFKSVLFRPIRACGVVKNEGEPGGGPFWVMSENKVPSLQIVESSQVNANDKEQMEIFKQATHFNPVDLVCAVKNYKGEKYKLADFVDSTTCFISSKSKNGKELKALELPGLWNGAMANWNTIFVEVPISTFNPVKTVNDLLRPAHQ